MATSKKISENRILEIYTEAKSQEEADGLADRIIGEIKGVAEI